MLKKTQHSEERWVQALLNGCVSDAPDQSGAGAVDNVVVRSRHAQLGGGEGVVQTHALVGAFGLGGAKAVDGTTGSDVSVIAGCEASAGCCRGGRGRWRGCCRGGWGRRSGGCRSGRGAVSYTHLDVYKRQVLEQMVSRSNCTKLSRCVDPTRMTSTRMVSTTL